MTSGGSLERGEERLQTENQKKTKQVLRKLYLEATWNGLFCQLVSASADANTRGRRVCHQKAQERLRLFSRC